jgi:hypothetical protein
VTGAALTWAAFGLVLALMAARATIVETGHRTLGRTPVKVQVITGALGVALVTLVLMVVGNGGAEFVSLIINGDPAETAAAVEDAPAPADVTVVPDVPASVAPGAPAAR